MDLPLKLAVHGDNLRPLCDAWAEVQRILDGSRLDAVIFTERAFVELQAALYVRAELTGLYWPTDTHTALTYLGDMGVSNFAHEATADKGGWGEFRVTPNAFDNIIRCARDVKRARPGQLASNENNAGVDQSNEGNLGHYADDSRWPQELDIAITAWRAACNNAEQEGKRPGAYIRDWLIAHYPELSEEARKRISTIANWDKTPGAAKK